MNRAFLAGSLVACVASQSGCATVFKGTKQEVHIASEPTGVDVRSNGLPLGSAPTSTEIPRGRPIGLSFSKEGYKTQHVQLAQHPDAGWWVWDIGSCIIPVAACIPLLVDAVSGAWYDFDDDVRVRLEPGQDPPPTSETPAAAPLDVPPADKRPVDDGPPPAQPNEI